MAILKTTNITKHFGGVNAVDHLSIKIEKGVITGIIGPNGSGKTTLINLLSGMIPLDDGSVVINSSNELREIIPHKVNLYGITRTFQDVRLFEQITVLDNILVVLTAKGVFASLFEKQKKYHLEQTEEVLKRVELWEKRNSLAVNLSYGQRKLLEIARTLATKADIYLLDEPFAGLSPEMTKTVSLIIQELKQQGKTVILIEHNMELIRKLSDYLFVMDEGKLLAEGNPNEVLGQKEVVEAYLGEISV